MRIGVSLVLIAIGAVLKFAVTATVSGVDLGIVGIVLMIIGLVGLIITLVLMSTRRRTDIVQHRNGTTYIEPNDADRIDPRY